MRVLDRDDAGRRHVAEVAAAGGPAHLLGREPPGPGLKRTRHQARVDGRPAQLGDQEVRVLLGDQLVAGLAQHAERDLVRHRRRRDEDRVVLAQRLRGAPLELVDGRVLPELLVADLRVRDRLAHRGRRLARRIGTEVDHRPIVAKARCAGRRSSGSGRSGSPGTRTSASGSAGSRPRGLHALRHPPDHERDEPADDRDEEHHDGEDVGEDKGRDREDQPEEGHGPSLGSGPSTSRSTDRPLSARGTADTGSRRETGTRRHGTGSGDARTSTGGCPGRSVH